MAKSQTKKTNSLAFVFPESLSTRIKRLQKEMNAKSAGEVLIKGISLLELSLGRSIEIKDEKTSKKWEINEFEDFENRVNID